MLILTRRLNEKLQIGDDITVRVCSIVGGQVKLAIQAPRDVEVHREEVFLRIQKERAKKNEREVAAIV